MTVPPFFPFFRRTQAAVPAPAPVAKTPLELMPKHAETLFRVKPDILDHASLYGVVEAVYVTLRPVLQDRPDLLALMRAEEMEGENYEDMFYLRWSRVVDQARDDANEAYDLNPEAYHTANIAWLVASLSVRLKFGEMREAKSCYLTLWEKLTQASTAN